MKTKYNILFLLTIMILSAISCSKEDLVNLPKVTLNIDWTNRTEGVAIPSDYKVVINDREITYQNASNILPELNAGIYSAFIYNAANKIVVDGTVATVSTSGEVVDAQPGWLFYSDLDMDFENDKEKTVTAIMQQQIRQLNIELTITEGDPNDIESVTATLSGVANSVDMKTGICSGSGLKVIPVFARGDDKLTTTLRLIALTSETQNLTLDVTYNDGTVQQIISDISSELADFNIDKHKPVTLKGNAKIWSSIGFETTITGWELQDTIDDEAEIQ
jgi:hypothetical protein